MTATRSSVRCVGASVVGRILCGCTRETVRRQQTVAPPATTGSRSDRLSSVLCLCCTASVHCERCRRQRQRIGRVSALSRASRELGAVLRSWRSISRARSLQSARTGMLAARAELTDPACSAAGVESARGRCCARRHDGRCICVRGRYSATRKQQRGSRTPLPAVTRR